MEDNLNKNEKLIDNIEINKGNVEHQNELNTDKTSHSSHSHSHSNSHRSHHHGKHSSHHKKKNNSSKKNSLFDKIEKKVGQKRLKIISYSAVLCSFVIICSLYFFEKFSTPDISDIKGSYEENKSGYSEQLDNESSLSVSIPSYWKDMINEKTEVVKTLQTADGKNCVSFVWASDTHIPDNGSARTNNIGILMAAMMNKCDIPFAVLTGDVGTRASYDTETELLRTQESIPVHLAPLWGTDRLLLALGNHEGCYGNSSSYYAKQFSPERLWQLYFRNQALDSRRIFSEDGLYYYIDNVAQKTRFIVLNSNFAGKYSVDGNGNAINNRFATSCYGQEQLNWLANVALDMPKGYGAIIAAHVPPNVTYTVDKSQLIGIINAYCNRTTYSGSYTKGINGWTNNSVNVDFTNAKGEIIAMFSGHVHQDTIDTTTLACPLITIIAAGAEVNFGEAPERTFGTDTETSFDVVTINKKTRTIYCTRVGAGKDRAIKY